MERHSDAVAVETWQNGDTVSFTVGNETKASPPWTATPRQSLSWSTPTVGRTERPVPLHRQRAGDGEEYQCMYHEHILRMIEARHWLWATHVWNLFDFAADGRDEGGAHGVNQKGLVSFDRKLKKDAFYLYKAAWSREPFVYLCGSRYVNWAEETTQVKVYSNQGEVSLYVDGALVETQAGKTVFTFQVPITGEHTMEAVSGDCGIQF